MAKSPETNSEESEQETPDQAAMSDALQKMAAGLEGDKVGQEAVAPEKGTTPELQVEQDRLAEGAKKLSENLDQIEAMDIKEDQDWSPAVKRKIEAVKDFLAAKGNILLLAGGYAGGTIASVVFEHSAGRPYEVLAGAAGGVAIGALIKLGSYLARKKGIEEYERITGEKSKLRDL